MKEGDRHRLKFFAAAAPVICCLTLIATGAAAEAQDRGTPRTADINDGLDGPLGGKPHELKGVPDAMRQLDISGVESWDSLDDPDNTVLTEFLGAGAIVTGVGWNLTLTTNGASWLSEAVIYFDGSDQDGVGLNLTPGVGDTIPGTMTYSSGGILDLTDLGIPNIPILADGNLYLQFFESFDDFPDAVDAIYEPGSIIDVAYIDVANPIFADGFESGDTSFWSLAGTDVTIDFDDLPAETTIDGTVISGATFSTEPGFEIQTAAVDIAPSPPNIICTVPTDGGPFCTSEILVAFSGPVEGLSFKAVGARSPPSEVVAQVRIFSQGMLLGIEDILSQGDGSTPILVDLGAFSAVTEIEIFGIDDPAGIGYDDFTFTLTLMTVSGP